MTLTAPEELAGIAAYIADDLALRYEDTELYFALDDPAGVRPVDAASAVLHTLCTDEPTAIGTDLLDGISATHLTYEVPDSDPKVAREIWLDTNGLPLCAEIYLDGEKRVSLFFTDFTPAS